MQDHAADKLDIEGSHAKNPLGGLAHHREGLREQIVERFAVRKTLPELVGLRVKRLVVEAFHRRLELVDLADNPTVTAQCAVVARANDPLDQIRDHISCLLTTRL